MDEVQNLYAEWKKLDNNEYMVYNSIYTNYTIVKVFWGNKTKYIESTLLPFLEIFSIWFHPPSSLPRITAITSYLISLLLFFNPHTLPIHSQQNKRSVPLKLLDDVTPAQNPLVAPSPS